MAKTYRTCQFGCLMPWCSQHDASSFACDCESCELHEPRETPLLVDELAYALRRLIQPVDGEEAMDWGFYLTLQKDRVKQAKKALSRYQKEMGDA